MSLIKLTLATEGQEGHGEINSTERKGVKKGRDAGVIRVPATQEHQMDRGHHGVGE